MPFYTSIGMSNGEILSTNIDEFNGEIPATIMVNGTKDGEPAVVCITDEFFSEDNHRGDPLSFSTYSNKLDEIHSMTVFGHTKKATANMKQLLAIGMRYAAIYTPVPPPEESENSEFTE